VHSFDDLSLELGRSLDPKTRHNAEYTLTYLFQLSALDRSHDEPPYFKFSQRLGFEIGMA
jgi:hypothetical protein